MRKAQIEVYRGNGGGGLLKRLKGYRDSSGSSRVKKAGSTNSIKSSKHLRVSWWNGGGAVLKRLSVNPGLGKLLKSYDLFRNKVIE